MVHVLVDPSYLSVLCAVVCRGALFALSVRGRPAKGCPVEGALSSMLLCLSEVPYQRSSVFLPSVPFIVRSAQSDTSPYLLCDIQRIAC